MDSPPFRPKPIPAHFINGHSPLAQSSKVDDKGKDKATETRDRKERDNLYSSIEASHRGRQIVNFDGPEGYFPTPSMSTDAHGPDTHQAHEPIHSGIDVEGYVDEHSPKTPLATSRAHSPYTQHPTIDFDGLSWPSR
jgi:GTP cyclohydrolase I